VILEKLQSGINVIGEPKMKIQDPISKKTLMKLLSLFLFMLRCLI
jgi:hypothetical protein